VGKIQDISDAIAQALGAKPQSRTPAQINDSWWKSNSYTKKEREALAKADKKPDPRGDRRRDWRGRVEKPMDFYVRQRQSQEAWERKQQDAQRRQQDQQRNRGDDGPRDGKII